MKRRFKILPLGFPYKFEEFDDWKRPRDQIPPRFNRPGLYFDRKDGVSWVELADGTAWIHDAKQFLYELSLFDHRPLRPKEASAIRLLMRENLAGERLKKLFWHDRDWKSIRDVYRDSYRHILRRKESA